MSRKLRWLKDQRRSTTVCAWRCAGRVMAARARPPSASRARAPFLRAVVRFCPPARREQVMRRAPRCRTRGKFFAREMQERLDVRHGVPIASRPQCVRYCLRPSRISSRLVAAEVVLDVDDEERRPRAEAAALAVARAREHLAVAVGEESIPRCVAWSCPEEIASFRVCRALPASPRRRPSLAAAHVGRHRPSLERAAFVRRIVQSVNDSSVAGSTVRAR